jgi:hypothetical protein
MTTGLGGLGPLLPARSVRTETRAAFCEARKAWPCFSPCVSYCRTLNTDCLVSLWLSPPAPDGFAWWSVHNRRALVHGSPVAARELVSIFLFLTVTYDFIIGLASGGLYNSPRRVESDSITRLLYGPPGSVAFRSFLLWSPCLPGLSGESVKICTRNNGSCDQFTARPA